MPSDAFSEKTISSSACTHAADIYHSDGSKVNVWKGPIEIA